MIIGHIALNNIRWCHDYLSCSLVIPPLIYLVKDTCTTHRELVSLTYHPIHQRCPIITSKKLVSMANR